MLSIPPTVETRQRTPFSLTTPAQTRSTPWPCGCSSYCCVLGKSGGRATEPILRCCCRISFTTMSNKNASKKRRKPGIWYRTTRAHVLRPATKVYLATVRETANSSASNYIFNFQRRGLPTRRARKMLWLYHYTHGSAPRKPYLPCKIMDRY